MISMACRSSLPVWLKKGSATCGKMRSYRLSSSRHLNHSRQKETPYIASRMLKRSSPYSSTLLEAHAGKRQSVKDADQKSKKRSVDLANVHRNVDDFGFYAGGSLGETFYNRLNGYSAMDRAKLDTCDLVGSSERNDSDDDATSVGSCSANTGQEDKFFNCSFAVPSPARVLDSSDAKSFYCSIHEGDNCCPCFGDDIEVSIHKLELQAYRCTLEALYASGPLSWDKELLLTNLRIMLHISNDEHLTELNNLIAR